MTTPVNPNPDYSDINIYSNQPKSYKGNSDEVAPDSPWTMNGFLTTKEGKQFENIMLNNLRVWIEKEQKKMKEANERLKKIAEGRDPDN